MITLFIDFASKHQFVALVDEKKVLAKKYIDDHKAEAELMPFIKSILADVDLKFSDLTQIASVTGPGGFTSLRVGAALGNALAYGLNIPSAGIHLSDLWGEAQKKIMEDFVWLHSTRKTAVFIRGFGKYAKKWPEPTLVSLEDIKHLSDPAKGVGELIPEHIEALPNIKMQLSSVYETSVPGVVSALTYEQNKTLLPWYGRDV